MQFKTGQIQKILGCSAATESKWFDAINAACAKYNINTKLRLAAFIAQVGHESGRLSAVSENLNYSAAGLQGTWPSRFDATLAASCARNPEKIANVVYCNRMGNGTIDSGDGWKYRGRGLIQCTGKSNYSAFSQSAGVDCVSNPDLLAQPQNAAMSAGWFWDSKGLNSYADRGDLLTITKRINGGTNGQDDRDKLYKIALIVLSDGTPTDDAVKKVEPTPDTTAPVSEQKTPAAQNSSISEPKGVSGDAAKYPWNFVTESRSGHFMEVDDTPGSERLNMTHRTGTYWEIDSLGTITHKSVLDAYKITQQDSYDYIGGNYTQQVKGQSYRQSTGDMIFKTTNGSYFITATKVQMNTGMLAVSGEINSPAINASMFGGMSGGFAYGDLLSRESLVAYDLKDGGAPMLGGSLGFTSGANSDPSAAGSADSQLTNNLSKQSPSGVKWITNGVPANATTPTPGNDSSTGGLNDLSGGTSGSTQSSTLSGGGVNSGYSSSDPDIPPQAGTGFRVSDLAAVGIGAAGVAAAVSSLIKNNDPDPSVANAMASAVGDINTQSYAATNQTPVFIKHVSFDKPVLLSQSLPGLEPDPALYVNNYHTIVDPVTGIGSLHISDGTSWNKVNDLAASQAYTDASVQAATIDYNNKILAEANSRNDAISAAVLQEAIDRGAAVTAEATARQNADTSMSDLITTLTASVNGNAAAIETEAQARADAITAEANARQTLASQVDANSSAITTEATTRANADSTNASAIQTVTSRINNGNAASYAPFQTWPFNNVLGGWTAAGATVAITSGEALLTSSSTNPQFISPAINIPGIVNNKIRARVKRISGSGWSGTVYFATGAHGFSGTYKATLATDPGLADWYVIEWDMANLTAGGSDWTSNTITQIRIDLGATSSDVFQIDWVSVGSRLTGVDGYSFATVQTQASTSVTDVNNIKAQWAIKANVNGYVSGIALVNDLINGNPTSSFAVQANVFKLVSPDNSQVATPFTVDSNGNANFSGKLSAATGSFAGTLSAATGTYAGSLSAATGTFSGSLSAATGTFSGALSAATGSFSGTLNAATGSFSGGVYGGAYGNAYAWPANGAGGGFYLGPNGLLLGNANQPGYGYFQVTSNGSVYAPGLTIQNGSLTVRGDVQANSISGTIVDTGNVVNHSISNYAWGGQTQDLWFSIPNDSLVQFGAITGPVYLQLWNSDGGLVYQSPFSGNATSYTLQLSIVYIAAGTYRVHANNTSLNLQQPDGSYQNVSAPVTNMFAFWIMR